LAENGEPGEARRLRLELRLLADVGLVGFPNAGKSTLISRISGAHPKIADYPFTTLSPTLGVVRVGDESFVVADIPGLIEGAHKGKGLGDRFLRHVRRAALLVFLVDLAARDRDPANDVDVLRSELEAFDPDLARRPSLVVAAKADVGGDRLDAVLERLPDALPVSAVTGRGVDDMLHAMLMGVKDARRTMPEPIAYARHVVRDEPISIEREDGAWRVRGRTPEAAVARTDMNNEEAVARLQRQLISMGVERALAASGAVEGDEVRIGEAIFDYIPDPGVPR
jgi:GTPase